MDIRSLLGSEDQELHDLVMRNAPMTAVIVGTDHIIVKVLGGELLDHLRYPWPDEVLGQPVEIFVPEAKRQDHKKWFDAWMADPEDRRLREAAPMTVVAKDGSSASVRIVLRKLYIEDGANLGREYAGKPFRGGIAYVVIDE